MVDIKLVRQNPDMFRQATAAKRVEPKIIDDLLAIDEERRAIVQRVDELRGERNKLPAGPEAREAGIRIKKELVGLEEQLAALEAKQRVFLRQIPNPALPDVKVGRDDTENDVTKTWGEIPRMAFPPKDHLEIGERLGIIDTERASKVSGSRFAYLKGDGVMLEFALVNLAMRTLTAEGFVPVVPPVLIKKESMAGMGYLEHGGEEDMYVLEKDNLVLTGTSEQSIGPMHMNEVLEASALPLRYAGFSHCFRREAGSYGKDTRGIIRVHQFDKVEMFSFTRPEDSDREHEFLLSLEERFLQTLELPYRVIKMCTGDLGMPAARKYDLEAWMPAQGKYREVTSTSTCTDFQARGLNIRYRDRGQSDYVHMLNGTAFAIGRMIVAILENNQTAEGNVRVPRALREYVGKDLLSPNTDTS